MSISLERRLVSARLRPLLQNYLREGLGGTNSADLATLRELIIQVADGDQELAAQAMGDLERRVMKDDPAQIDLLEFYFEGTLDLACVVEGGKFAWTASTRFKETSS